MVKSTCKTNFDPTVTSELSVFADTHYFFLFLSAWSGFIFQAMGIMFEASRLVAIQKLLHGLKMDPLVSLYWFAPVCRAFRHPSAAAC